jgi:flagellar biosynthesis/type III secretory pathway protein FliH
MKIAPFLSTIPAGETRPLGRALPSVDGGEPAPSPWSPKADPAQATPVFVDHEAARAEAMARGREDGLRETAELRARLTKLTAAIDLARSAVAALSADLIADAATTVVSAWTESADRRDLFAPIVRGWLARATGDATAHVHPSEVEAMRAVVGDAPIQVVADNGIARGNVQIRSAELELAHQWEPRLRELREAIATAVEENQR